MYGLFLIAFFGLFGDSSVVHETIHLIQFNFQVRQQHIRVVSVSEEHQDHQDCRGADTLTWESTQIPAALTLQCVKAAVIWSG